MTRLMLRLLLVPLLALVATGCASSGYLANRGRDAADVFTLTIGAGTGVKGRVGPLMLAAEQNADLVGLRGGAFFAGGNGLILNDEAYLPIPVISATAILKRTRGPQWQHPKRPQTEEQKSADQAKKDAVPKWQREPSIWSRICGEEGFSLGPLSMSDYRNKHVVARSPFPLVVVGQQSHFYTQVEGMVGFIISVRAGFNIGELTDLLLGLFTVDIYGDDLEKR